MPDRNSMNKLIQLLSGQGRFSNMARTHQHVGNETVTKVKQVDEVGGDFHSDNDLFVRLATPGLWDFEFRIYVTTTLASSFEFSVIPKLGMSGRLYYIDSYTDGTSHRDYHHALGTTASLVVASTDVMVHIVGSVQDYGGGGSRLRLVWGRDSGTDDVTVKKGSSLYIERTWLDGGD